MLDNENNDVLLSLNELDVAIINGSWSDSEKDYEKTMQNIEGLKTNMQNFYNKKVGA